MADLAPLQFTDETRPSAEVVSLIRAEIRRTQREANERDNRALRAKLLRALYTIRPETRHEPA